MPSVSTSLALEHDALRLLHRFSIDKHLGRHVDNKSDAEDEAAEIRKAIKAGTFGKPAARADMTLRQLADTYLERYVAVERKATEQAFGYALDTICQNGADRIQKEARRPSVTGALRTS